MAIVGGGRARRPVGFVAHLALKQAELGYGHGQFARLLGIDRSWWYSLRKGRVDPSADLAQRAMRLWPGEFDRFLPELILARGVGAVAEDCPREACA